MSVYFRQKKIKDIIIIIIIWKASHPEMKNDRCETRNSARGKEKEVQASIACEEFHSRSRRAKAYTQKNFFGVSRDGSVLRDGSCRPLNIAHWHLLIKMLFGFRIENNQRNRWSRTDFIWKTRVTVEVTIDDHQSYRRRRIWVHQESYRWKQVEDLDAKLVSQVHRSHPMYPKYQFFVVYTMEIDNVPTWSYWPLKRRGQMIEVK